MVITQLEARVDAGNEAALIDAYAQEVRSLDPGIVRTYLVHALAEPDLWRIITFWESREALDAMRGQGTPKGVLIFRAAGAEPALSIYNVDVAGE